MAIIIKQGDLLQASEAIIGHQVNCQGVMGSGIAKSIRARYPEAYDLYKKTCDKAPDKKELLGTCQLVHTATDKMVANLFGQEKFGRGKQRYTDYEALRKALVLLKDQAQAMQASVALPYKIGCGLANGEWSIVEAMIADVFQAETVSLYQWEA